MDFTQVIGKVCKRLDELEVRYALIGGFAMALRGVQRATTDLDFILFLDDLERADSVLTSFGYNQVFHNENVSHYQAKDQEFGRIDLLDAFRAPTLGMLDRADRVAVIPGVDLPVVQIEDIVGLKVQAAKNDPVRGMQDWADIETMMKEARRLNNEPDWELLQSYLSLFQQEDRLAWLKNWYGEAQ